MLVRQHEGVPEHQRIEKRENIAKRGILDLRHFSERTHTLIMQNIYLFYDEILVAKNLEIGVFTTC